MTRAVLLKFGGQGGCLGPSRGVNVVTNRSVLKTAGCIVARKSIAVDAMQVVGVIAVHLISAMCVCVVCIGIAGSNNNVSYTCHYISIRRH